MTTVPTRPSLTDLEWSAVSDPLPDAIWCEHAISDCDGVMGRVTTTLSGRCNPERHADSKLAVVRRFVRASRRRDHIAHDHAAIVFEHGGSSAQIDALALRSI